MIFICCVVPIYDGRASAKRHGFRFNKADFDDLSKFPLYKGGRTEVPIDSVVSIVYTLGMYRASSGGFVLTSNLISVILLSLA